MAWCTMLIAFDTSDRVHVQRPVCGLAQAPKTLLTIVETLWSVVIY